MLAVLLLSVGIASASNPFTVTLEPVPVSLTARAAAAPTPVFLVKGDKAPYPGMLTHEDRLPVLAYKLERYDKLAKDGVQMPPCKLSWKDWTLIAAVAFVSCGGGLWTGQRMK